MIAAKQKLRPADVRLFEETLAALQERLSLLKDAHKAASMFARAQKHAVLATILETLEMSLRLADTHLEESQLEEQVKQRLVAARTEDAAALGDIAVPSAIRVPEGALVREQLLQQNPLETEFSEMASMLTTTETHLVEISRLQATLAFHLAHQEAQIERLAEDASFTRDTVQRGNAELQAALRRGSSGLREMIIACVLLLALAILLVHFLSP